MAWVRVGLQVAIRALEDRVVIRICMAGGAHVVGSSVRGWEGSVLRVIEARVQPCRSGVAVLTSRGEELWLRGVSWIGRLVVIRLMATDAGSRQRRVVVIHMAIRALARWNSMQARQRKNRVVVIERRIRPRDGVVANFALLRESCSPVVWIRGA